jgi:hypothetical protein
MHVYLRDEAVDLEMRMVDAEGLVPEGSDLVPVAFHVRGKEQPSFRALLPPDTIAVLQDALTGPVSLGVLAEEPDEADAEIQAMVGLALPINEGELGEGADEEEGPQEPWKATAPDPDAWRGDDAAGDETEAPRTALLAFAPLVRLRRKFPEDFGEELADLLEAALAGATRPALEARVDRMLGDL